MERTDIHSITEQEQKKLDRHFMQIALTEAQLAAQEGEIPIGAVLVWNQNQVVAIAHNLVENDKNATRHAELICLNEAMSKLQMKYLTQATMYVTLEPCPMCAGALVLSKVKRLVYGATDPKAGAVSSLYSITSDQRLNHRLEIIPGVMEQECSEILKSFFKKLRDKS